MAGQQVALVANQIERQRLGYQAISLTEYDTTLEPKICAGSKVEIAGALYEFAALESITGWGAIAVSSDVYIKLVVAVEAVTAEFTTTAPTWSTSKQGWYDGLDRYVFRLYKDAAGNYVQKSMLSDMVQPMSPEHLLFSFTPADGTEIMWASDIETDRNAYTGYRRQVMMPFTGTVNVAFDSKAGGAPTIQIYKNGVATGTLRSPGIAYATYSEAVAVTCGDILQLYTTAGAGEHVFIKNFRIRCSKKTAGSLISMLPVFIQNE